jgi:signal peptidase I
MRNRSNLPRSTAAAPAVAGPQKETWVEQASSFVGFFIYLLVLKSFFLPLFIIPTGSMAEGLCGAHAAHTCPNCGTEYNVGWQEPPVWPPAHWRMPPGTPFHPLVVECPNCRWQQFYDFGSPQNLLERGYQRSEILSNRLTPVAGDRIFVHGWPFEGVFTDIDAFGPQRWDVVVFKVPTDGDTNYIKRLIGLPGEKIELIDGDVFVNGQLARKTADAQHTLWFSYYDHDHPPAAAALRTDYYPRWAPRDDASTWTGLDGRVLCFYGPQKSRAELQFCTDPRNSKMPGLVQDLYAYNEPHADTYHLVTDVRLSAEVTLEGGTGYVELSTSKGAHRFYLRLGADGVLRLQHDLTGENPDDTTAERETWDQQQVPLGTNPVRLALSHLDGVVSAEIDGRTVLESKPAQYELRPESARPAARPPVLRIAAENTRATLRHVLIQRDVYYTSDVHLYNRPGFAVQGSPLELGPDAYLMLGDNSPNSLDGRFGFSHPMRAPVVAPHLARRPEYRPGTVPRDQLLGRAFFVYWPGFQPLTPRGPNLLVDLGRARWIH